MLRKEQESLWRQYLEAEEKHVRHELLERLDAFILDLERCDRKLWAPWAKSIVRWKVDEEKDIPIRIPLFCRILFPVLLEGYRKQETGCARWLAGLSQLLYQSEECMKELPDGWSEISLLRVAIRHDADDSLARKNLIKALARQLDYSVHEVPSGVLYGNNGASLEECLELERDLDELRQLLKAEKLETEYENFVEKCAYHYKNYALYLKHSKDYENYRDFLDRSGGR